MQNREKHKRILILLQIQNTISLSKQGVINVKLDNAKTFRLLNLYERLNRILFSEYNDYFEHLKINEIDNIFKYVVPVVIHVTQDFRDNRIGLIYKFKCDIENGLCVVFKDGKIENVGYDYVQL